MMRPTSLQTCLRVTQLTTLNSIIIGGVIVLVIVPISVTVR